jgi:Leucine-rich repeat (LRR) protein
MGNMMMMMSILQHAPGGLGNRRSHVCCTGCCVLCRLQELPCTFAALSCLKLLFLGHNKLATLPNNLTRLFLLSTLDFSHNKLQQLPQHLHQLQSLARLNLQHNQLVGLPPGLSGLTGLERLAFGCNQGLQLQQGSLAGLRALTCLELAGIGLTDEALDAAVQQDGSPPSTAAAAADGSEPCTGSTTSTMAAVVLPSLRMLDVSHNQLQLLPQWLPPSMCCLLAAGNRIPEVPHDLLAGLAGSLLQLDLQDNLLQDLPAQLRLLSRLQVLALQGNPGLNPALVDKGMGMVWAYKWLTKQKSAAASAAHRAVVG